MFVIIFDGDGGLQMPLAIVCKFDDLAAHL